MGLDDGGIARSNCNLNSDEGGFWLPDMEGPSVGGGQWLPPLPPLCGSASLPRGDARVVGRPVQRGVWRSFAKHAKSSVPLVVCFRPVRRTIPWCRRKNAKCVLEHVVAHWVEYPVQLATASLVIHIMDPYT